MKFKYTALGASNQKLEGILEAESLDAAREKLHKMELSVVAVEEVSAEEAAVSASVETAEVKTQEGIITYYFLARDAQGKEVNGTIDSKDPNSAFRRLMAEYQFEVLDLYPQNTLDPVGDSLQPQFEEWKTEMEDEGIDLTQKRVVSSRDDNDEGETTDEEVVAEIDQFIINTKKLLSGYSMQYSDALLREIEETLGELERIRASNNLKRITRLCNELYELMANPDVEAKPGEEVPPDPVYQETISKLGKSGFVANDFKFLEFQGLQKRFKRFEKLNTLLNKVFKKKGEDPTGQGYKSKLTKRRNRWVIKLTRMLQGSKVAGQPTFTTVVSKFFNYLAASNKVLRRARKKELLKTLTAWKEAKKKAKAMKAQPDASVSGETPAADQPDGELPPVKPPKIKKDHSMFFMELDSFVGWLLFFYIAYFFLVSFSVERNIGLPVQLVFKTLASPLIVNICIFLVFAHLALTLKVRFFRSNFLGSLFLFFFTFGIYSLLMVNF